MSSSLLFNDVFGLQIYYDTLTFQVNIMALGQLLDNKF